jgi:hypothetical protein
MQTVCIANKAFGRYGIKSISNKNIVHRMKKKNFKNILNLI